MRPLYRVRQFLGVFARPDRAALQSEAAAILTKEQRALFDSLSPYDQRHAVEVLQRLRAEGHDGPEFLQAALLHDVGKAFIRARVWHRVAHVLLRAVGLDGAGESRLRGYARHAEVGADLAEKSGSAPEVVAWIRAHHQPLEREPETDWERLLVTLQDADDAV